MRTSRRLFLSTGVAVAALATTMTAATAAQGPETAGDSDLNASIVWVEVWFDADVVVPWADGSATTYPTQVGASCTGFFVSGTGDIATAGHCVETSNEDVVAAISNVFGTLDGEGYDMTGFDPAEVEWDVAFSAPTAYVGQPAGVTGAVLASDGMVAQVVDHQPFEAGDNALLRVADLTGTPALPISDHTPAVGDEVVSIGFPGSVSLVSDVQRQLPSYKTGAVSSRQYSDKGVPTTEIDAAVSPGMSGGPTIDAGGAVIGINSFLVVGESQPFNFITDTETLRTFLTSNGVDIVTGSTTLPADGATPATLPEQGPAAPQPEQDGASPMPWVLGIGGLLLVSALVVMVTLARAGRRPAAAQPTFPVAAQPTVPPTPPAQPVATAPAWWPAQTPEELQPVEPARQEVRTGPPMG